MRAKSREQKNFVKHFLLFLLTFTSLLLADQLLKGHTLRTGRALVNPGISFGWLGNWKQLELLTLGILITFLIALVARILIKKSPVFQITMKSPASQIFKKPGFSLLPSISFALLLAGVLSNLLDRFFYPGVIDYLYLPVLNLHNNLADWGMFLGVILFLTNVILIRQLTEKNSLRTGYQAP